MSVPFSFYSVDFHNDESIELANEGLLDFARRVAGASNSGVVEELTSQAKAAKNASELASISAKISNEIKYCDRSIGDKGILVKLARTALIYAAARKVGGAGRTVSAGAGVIGTGLTKSYVNSMREKFIRVRAQLVSLQRYVDNRLEKMEHSRETSAANESSDTILANEGPVNFLRRIFPIDNVGAVEHLSEKLNEAKTFSEINSVIASIEAEIKYTEKVKHDKGFFVRTARAAIIGGLAKRLGLGNIGATTAAVIGEQTLHSATMALQSKFERVESELIALKRKGLAKLKKVQVEKNANESTNFFAKAGAKVEEEYDVETELANEGFRDWAINSFKMATRQFNVEKYYGEVEVQFNTAKTYKDYQEVAKIAERNATYCKKLKDRKILTGIGAFLARDLTNTAATAAAYKMAGADAAKFVGNTGKLANVAGAVADTVYLKKNEEIFARYEIKFEDLANKAKAKAKAILMEKTKPANESMEFLLANEGIVNFIRSVMGNGSSAKRLDSLKRSVFSATTRGELITVINKIEQEREYCKKMMNDKGHSRAIIGLLTQFGGGYAAYKASKGNINATVTGMAAAGAASSYASISTTQRVARAKETFKRMYDQYSALLKTANDRYERMKLKNANESSAFDFENAALANEGAVSNGMRRFFLLTNEKHVDELRSKLKDVKSSSDANKLLEKIDSEISYCDSVIKNHTLSANIATGLSTSAVMLLQRNPTFKSIFTTLLAGGIVTTVIEKRREAIKKVMTVVRSELQKLREETETKLHAFSKKEGVNMDTQGNPKLAYGDKEMMAALRKKREQKLAAKK